MFTKVPSGVANLALKSNEVTLVTVRMLRCAAANGLYRRLAHERQVRQHCHWSRVGTQHASAQ